MNPLAHEMQAASTISRLAKKRLRIVAPIEDPAWQGREFVQRAFRLKDSAQVLVKDGLTIYLPLHSLDWQDHPAAHTSLEMIVFRADDSHSKVQVDFLRPNTLFFFVPKERSVAILEGRQTELDLLRDLERNLTYPTSTP